MSTGPASAPPSSQLGTFRRRMAERTALIGVVGLGYVGLPLALRFAEAGFRVLGFDIDPAKLERLAAGQSYIEHIRDEQVAAAVASGLALTGDMRRAGEADAVILCVPTPLSRTREPDLRYVKTTLDAIAPALRPGQVVSLESTTYPFTTEEEVVPRVTAGGLAVGEDIFVVYAPEREDPGNERFSIAQIPRVVGGVTPACSEAGVALYEAAVARVIPVSSPRTAEMTKLLENIQRAVNIGLMNEMKLVAERMGVDIFEVIDAAATKPFGFTPYYPGPGIGGHCIPVDPFFLTWKAREFGLHTRFIELAGEINAAMPHHVVERIAGALNDRGKPVRGARALVLGLAYKPNVDDCRESPSIVILEELRRRGAEVGYSDPHVPRFPEMRAHRLDLESQPLTAESLAGADVVVLATAHDAFDGAFIEAHAPLVVDTHGKLEGRRGNVVRA